MKTHLALFLSGLCAVALADPSDPQISNLDVGQDISRNVHITFTLDEPAYITMDILTNHVSIGVDKFSNATGDVNKLVPAGRCAIEWKARQSWPDQHSETPALSVKLTAWAADNPPDVMDIDLVNKTVAYYQSVDFLPDGGLANDIYRTTHLVMKKVRAAGMTFHMGSPEDEAFRTLGSGGNEMLHAVSFTNDYYLAIYETTRKQFELLGCPEPPFGTANTPYGSDDPNQCPQDRITYNRLRGSTGDGIDWPTTGSTVGGYLATIRTATGLALDIPTEAQWEFACRAGTTTQNYSGTDYSGQYSSTVGEEIAWYYYNSDSGTTVHAVGGKPANPWGFYDMYGNVQEWCLDWVGAFDTSVSPAINPKGPATGTSRSIRGSNYAAMSAHIRSAYRGGGAPQDANGRFGFRLSLTLP